jgi:hypothetical protein
MEENLYVIDGKAGAWKITAQFLDDDDNIVMVFQNIGSGEYLEVEVCPFDWIIKHTTIKKWDSK